MPHAGRRLVEAVGHDDELLRRQPDPVDVEAAQRLGDADHPRRSAGDRPLDEAERAGAERVVVVLRRDERALAADERAEHVGVDEMRVEDVRPSERARPSARAERTRAYGTSERSSSS